MPDTDAQPVLRRKLAPPRPQRSQGQGSLHLLLAMTMPRDAEELLGLQVGVIELSIEQRPKAQVIAGIDDKALIYLMKSDGSPKGICLVEPGLLAGLIEVQMSGRVSASAPPERRATTVDGIVASDIIDKWIASAKAEAAEQGLLERLPFRQHYRSQTLADARSADLALDPGEYTVMKVVLELSGGAKSGALTFVIPLRSVRSAAPSTAGPADLSGSLMETRAALSVVLARIPQSIGQVSRLEVGDVIDVPISALGNVILEDREGRVISTGRLGQKGGRKAVLIAADEPGDGGEPAENRGTEFIGAKMRPASIEPKAPEPGQADDLADLTELPVLPEVDGLDAAAGEAGFPELPDLPDLPELPDLPD